MKRSDHDDEDAGGEGPAAGHEDAVGEVTRLLRDASTGDREALDRMMPLIYDEMEAIAGQFVRSESADLTLDSTALVHEVYLKLVDQDELPGASRAHFLAIAARAMRQVLIDSARRRKAEKRGGDGRWERTTLSSSQLDFVVRLDDVLALDEAMERLRRHSEQMGRIVECKFFAGMTEAEIAGALSISPSSVRRDWIKARAWLYRELHPGDAADRDLDGGRDG